MWLDASQRRDVAQTEPHAFAELGSFFATYEPESNSRVGNPKSGLACAH